MQTETKLLPFIDFHPINCSDSNEKIKVVVRFRTNDSKDIDSIQIKEDGKSVTIKRNENLRKSQTLTHRGSIRGVSIDPNIQQKTKFFTYDAVTDKEDQKFFYESYAKDNVIAFLKGYNSTILAYGSTGSGKTFTIVGDESIESKILKSNFQDSFEQKEKYGILPRSIQTIYDELEKAHEKGIKYQLRCSYLEVYNEELTDMLSRSGQNQASKKPIIQECPKKGIVIQNMVEEPVNSYKEIMKCLQKGLANRKVCITQDNSRSSRSHTIFMLNLEQIQLDQTQILSRLCIVDLAGSEKLQSNHKNRLQETKNINTSLLTLAKCITHLSKAQDKNEKKHVPFRESKLTRILKESLGGNSKTTLICAARFSDRFQEETIQTLRFAREAKKIQNELAVKIVYTEEQLLEQIQKLKQENEMLINQIFNLKKQYSQDQANNLDLISQNLTATSANTIEQINKNNKDTLKNGQSNNLKSRNDIGQQSKQTSMGIDQSILAKQYQELMSYKMRYDSLKNSSEEQIMKLNKEIQFLNQQLAKPSDQMIQEIEQTIQKLSSKYYQQEQEIQQEKKIMRDVQKVLAETQTSPMMKNQNDFQISTEDEEAARNSEDSTGCRYIECINNKLKIKKFENLFVEFEKQYSKLYLENQQSRNILQEISQRLKGINVNDFNILNESQYQMSRDHDSLVDIDDKSYNDDQLFTKSYDEQQEELFLNNLNKEINEFEKQDRQIQESIQQFSAKLNKFKVMNQRCAVEKNVNDFDSFYKIQTQSDTIIPLNLIEELGIQSKHDEEIRSPISSILPFENRGSSRRDKMKMYKNGLNSSYYGEKTPQSIFKPYNSYFNQQEITPSNRLNQSYMSNSSKFSEVLDQNLADIDLSRIENSNYDDYEDDNISENLYGNHKYQNGNQKPPHQKQLFQEENIDILNMSDITQTKRPLQKQKSMNLSHNNLSFYNESSESPQVSKLNSSDIFGINRKHSIHIGRQSLKLKNRVAISSKNQ
ncbi:kinesin motor catalytic domain protein (macronuclear) [Tetrahymena thermophila SB210]|uniref:Kinesin-like protein n=1 Tax=Tetrahymena thermophila (strain SB210) TaxID=312017 RepID=Q23KG7_TETTS|nr:kinesin motor catalytic domain protein [Tetrahymena thermophila SB210]EAR96876.2 kinesin motor catalytic domain protein [Tetrahymena thermophila SB210]|eukprot:XP_001017121.2 kinesin motor catalytic domain protein [Tetrahymena thermophila SB210]